MGKDVKIGIGVALCIGLLLFVFLVIRGGNEGTAVGPAGVTPTPPAAPSTSGTRLPATAPGGPAAATPSKPATTQPGWTTVEELGLIQQPAATKERTAEAEIVGIPPAPAAPVETGPAATKPGPSGPASAVAPSTGGVTGPSRESTVVQVGPAAPRPQTYTTEKGDTLWGLATRFYGDGRQWKKIYEANRDVLPSSSEVPVGVALVIPSAEGQPGAAAPETPAIESRPAAVAGMGTYTVERGDTLYSIARKQYGDGSLWRVISEANRDRVPDPEHLSVGTVLVIPPASEK